MKKKICSFPDARTENVGTSPLMGSNIPFAGTTAEKNMQSVSKAAVSHPDPGLVAIDD